MTTMLAARLHKVGEPMKLEHVPVPEPRPTDVLVAVKACGVVPNLINVLTHWQSWFPELPLPELPAIFGLDVAGVVAALAIRYRISATGDRVYVTPGLYCGSCPACRADDTMNCTNYTFRGYFGFGPDSQRLFDAYPYGGMCEYMTAPQHNLVPLADTSRSRKPRASAISAPPMRRCEKRARGRATRSSSPALPVRSD